MPNKYPESSNYGPDIWKAKFTKRLRDEGRYDEVRDARLDYKKKTGCSNDESWVWACEEYKPLLPKHDLKPKPSSAFNTPNFIADVVEASEKPELDYRDELRWAFHNRSVGGVSLKDAPSLGAYEFLQIWREQPELLLKSFLAEERRYSNSNEGKGWINDDDELADLMARLEQEIRAAVSGEGIELCPSGANGSIGEHQVSEGTSPPLLGEPEAGESSAVGVQA